MASNNDNGRYHNTETFVFHGSWMKVIQYLDEEQQLRFIKMVNNYGCFGKEPSEDDVKINEALWNMIKLEIDFDQNKRDERIESQRKAAQQYREKKKNEKSAERQQNQQRQQTFDDRVYDNNNANADSNADADGNADADANVTVTANVTGINSHKDNLSNQNNSSSSSSSKEDDAVDGGGGDGGEVFSAKKKKVIRQCCRRGVDAEYAANLYDDLDSMDFEIAGKPVTSIVAYIIRKWTKDKKERAANERHEAEQKALADEKQQENAKAEKMQAMVDAKWRAATDALPEGPRECIRDATRLEYAGGKCLRLLVVFQTPFYETLPRVYHIDVMKLLARTFPDMTVEVKNA